VPPPGPDVPFDPPSNRSSRRCARATESGDGWVEYAQLLLNFHLKTTLAQDGDFGNSTLQAVLRFQKEKKLQVDGTIGNQTWAALREGRARKAEH
jgi:peptidoglycan hydrolase-like protein with peptidoglycan-binding domain